MEPKPVDAELWKQVDALLDAALDLPEHAREQFVAEAAAGNPALQGEVLSLLRAQSQASRFMERSAMKVAAEALAQDSHLTHQSLVGLEIGSYTIESLLGSGGMGEVYLAREVKLNRRVALKILPSHFVADMERVTRFKREALALSALNHPNLVTIHEVGEAGGLNFIAMEFVEGQTLRSMMRNGLKLKNSLSIAGQVAEALAAAHCQGIIHRDIKPDNIMVRLDGYVKLLDFGLAKLTESNAPLEIDEAHTQAGAAMGTLAYMSPEQAAGEATDQRTDIWGLGVVLYEMVTGRKPFDGGDRQVTVNAILSSEPDSASSFDPTLPAELDLILDKALEKDRDLRYQTAADFRADLRRLLRAIESGTGGSRGRTIVKSADLKAPRTRLVISVAAVVLLAAVGVAVWRYSQSRTAAAPDWGRATHVQLTDQPGTEQFPTLAPDGKSFVYASRVRGSWDLFLQRVGGKNATLLTPDTPSDETQPAFSSSGDRIAFRSTREPAGVYVMEATGENVRLVAAGGHNPSWSPDGKEIAYSTAARDVPSTKTTPTIALWVVRLETGAKRLVTEADALQPSWSPNAHRIAYWFMPPNVGRSEIATVASGGGPPVVVTKGGSTNWNPVWSPDGRFLYFASDRSGNMSFWRVAVEEETGRVLGEPEAVGTPSAFNRHLSFSRDGKRLLYVQASEQSNIRAVEFNPKSEKLVGQPFWVTRGDRRVVRPELSPDGRQFVIRMPRRSQDDIAVVNRDGTNWRDITNDKFFDRYPRWSPDGKRIVFASDRSGNYEIWSINADGTNLRQHTYNGESSASFPLWSPDGRRILFQTDSFLIAIIDADKDWKDQTSEPLPAPDGETHFLAWDWSPDGGKLAGTFDGAESAVGYYSFASRKYEKVAQVEGYPMWLSDPVWLSDSRRFIFSAGSKAYIADILTKRMLEVFDVGQDEIRGIGISNDDRLIYFSVYQSESDIWLMDLRQ